MADLNIDIQALKYTRVWFHFILFGEMKKSNTLLEVKFTGLKRHV